ncbi:MAG: DsrE/DsrF/DrsH-like family protein [Marinifilaceae bacterium]
MPTLGEMHFDNDATPNQKNIHIDAKGSQCPGPILALKTDFQKAAIGQTVTIEVTDPGFRNDVVSWCHVTQNELLSLTENEGVISAQILKHTEIGAATVPEKVDSLTIVMFSDELDRGLAAFNIALGALAMGMQVQVFFTFWGLSLIKNREAHTEHHSLKDKAIEHILPKDDKDLSLTHKNMFGLGKKMMERIMKEKNVPPLDFMVHLAKYDGIKFIACQMSMELMNLKKEDFMEGIEVGGVATMIEYARKSSLNYFV